MHFSKEEKREVVEVKVIEMCEQNSRIKGIKKNGRKWDIDNLKDGDRGEV